MLSSLLICPNWSYQGQNYQRYPKYFNGKLWPYHSSCFINSIWYAPAHKSWLFEKFIFELQASSYSFKITCILVRQVISLKKKWFCLKFTIFFSQSSASTPLILVSTSMKITSTSAAIIYNSIESGHPWRTPIIRAKGSDRRPFILNLDWILMCAT